MVDMISAWAKNLSIVIIIVSILEMILPNNTTKKYIKSVFGLFVVLNIISPFIGTDKIDEIQETLSEGLSYEYKEYDGESLEENLINNKISNIYITNIEKDMIEKLEEMGYKIDKIDLDVDFNNADYVSKVEMGVSKNKISETDSTDNANNTNNTNNANNINTTNTLEAKLEVVVEKIEPIMINNSNTNTNKEDTSNLACTSYDIDKISTFLIKEYGVSKQCLEIKSSY